MHLRPWPSMDADFLVSSGGGNDPTWSLDGSEIYYRRGNEMLTVAITGREGGVDRAPPRVLFTGVFHRDEWGDQSYDAAPDGRFLMLRPVPGGRVEFNWIADVQARLNRAR